MIHGPRYEPDYGLRYEQDYGPCYAPGHRYASGSRAALRVGPQGRAARRAAGPRYASGRRTALRAGRCGLAARLTKFSATAPLDLQTDERMIPIP